MPWVEDTQPPAMPQPGSASLATAPVVARSAGRWVEDSTPPKEEGGFWNDLGKAYHGRSDDPATIHAQIVPMSRDRNPDGSYGDRRFGAPQILMDAVGGLAAPARSIEAGFPALKEALGHKDDPEYNVDEMRKTVGLVAGGGLAASTLPKVAPEVGALAMNAVGPPVRAVTQGVSKAATAVASPVLNHFDPESAVARTLARRMMQQNPGMTIEDAIAKTQTDLANLGPDAVLADTGKSMQKLARNMAQGPGETAQIADDVLGGRQNAEKTAVIKSIRENVSPDSFFDVEAENLASKKKAGPFYERSYLKYPSVTSPGLQLLLEQEPLIKQGINKGVELQRIDASTARTRFDPKRLGVVDFNEAGDPILGNVTPLQLWHAGREGLDALYKAEVDPITKEVTKKGGRIAALRQSLSDEVKTLTGGEEGDFAKGDKIYADASKLTSALKSGRNYVDGAEEMTAKIFSALSPKEKEAYRSGVAQRMIEKIRSATGSGNLTPAEIMSVIQDESGIRRKLDVILPTKDQYNRFLGDIENRTRFRDTSKGIRNVSQTGSIALEEGQIAGDNLAAAGAIGKDLVTGNHAGALTRAAQWGFNQLKRLQMPESARNQIGKLLLSKDADDQAHAFALIRNAGAK